MTKHEFLQELANKLSEEMSPTEVMREIRYYEGYIDGDMARGKSEDEATSDLGSPILIARNILESPREETDAFQLFPEAEAEDAYNEGSYQGENHLTDEEVRNNEKEGGIATEEENAFSEEETEEETEEKTGSDEREKAEEDAFSKGGDIPIEDGDDAIHEHTVDYDTRRQRAQEEEDYGGQRRTEKTERKNEDGWNLFSFVLTLLIDVTAIVLMIRNAITTPNHVQWICGLVVVVIVLILLIREFRGGNGPHNKDAGKLG